MASKFIHLHVHTEYSLLDGLSKVKELVRYVKENDMDSIAITDHGVMYGVIEFYKRAREEGIKPIIGMEGYIVAGKMDDKDVIKNPNYHVLLLAKNLEGYKNLMKLTSVSHLEGYYYRPRFDIENLKKYSKGLICSSACPRGEVGQALINDDYKKAKKIVQKYLDIFGKDYYLEIQRHNFANFLPGIKEAEIKNLVRKLDEDSNKANEGIIKLSREMGVPLIATNDAHYIKKEDASAQDALICIATGKVTTDYKRLRYIDTPDFYIKTAKEMEALFPDLPDAIENTVKISKICNVEITLGEWYFPQIDLPKGLSADEYLKNLAYDALEEKIENVTDEYKKRLDYELNVIIKKGYAPYFLIYKDMIEWAASHGVPINVRGSVAGSLTTYVLGITIVNPLHYALPFERFLNPLRPSAPDIDLDISDNKRDSMIRYLTKKYGKDKVAQICTFGRMLARGSVRDIARVLGYEYAVGDRISKLIPMGSQGFPMTIERALSESSDLASLYDSDKDAKRIIDLAKQIEGSARHISVHAAGVVVSPTTMTDFTPLQREPSGDKVITQYEMHACEDVGLVKLDVLGIRNLTILQNAVKLVKELEDIKIDLLKIPLDDKKTFEMLSRGETMGTFQLNGSGMTKYLVELQPERIEDIMAMIALYRPGPIANIPDYIARKKGKQKITYYHPKMESFLEKSYGILVYQDDLLYTALEIAGYDWIEVDKFRKAVGKKIPEEMAKQHKIFVKGCMDNSDMTEKEAEGLWDLFEPFQGYGFNKAHAASYGMVAYQTAYMKANYPNEYMTALLTAESNDTEKVSSAVNECRRIGIKVLPPDINESDTDFKLVEDKSSLNGKAIRFGLNAIKNVGLKAIESILEARNNGEFISFADFLSKVDSRKVNKKVVESLIKVGAMMEFGPRAFLVEKIDEVRGKVSKSKANENQGSFFTNDDFTKNTKCFENIPDGEKNEFSDDEIQNLEKKLLGFSLSARPVSEMLSQYENLITHKIDELQAESITTENVKIAGIIENIRVIITKKTGAEMAFVKVQDDTGSIDLVIFPKVYQNIRSNLIDNKPLLISGKINVRDEDTSLIVDNLFDSADNLESRENEILYIKIPAGAQHEDLERLKELFLGNPGKNKVILIFKGNKKVELPMRIGWTRELSGKINNLLNTSMNLD